MESFILKANITSTVEEANRLADSLPDFEGIDNDSGNGSEEVGAAQAADDAQVGTHRTQGSGSEMLLIGYILYRVRRVAGLVVS